MIVCVPASAGTSSVLFLPLRGRAPAARARALAALRAGEVDLAVAFSYDGSELARGEDLEGFVVHPLLDEEVRVALPRDHPLAAKETVSMTDLTDEEWIAGCAREEADLYSYRRDGRTGRFAGVIGRVA